jgi:hypothetical protein
MDKMTFYEQVGIVIPGSVLLVGLLFYFPTLNGLIASDGVTLGQFGIFLLLAYASGHLVAAVGNAIEAVLWRFAGGMPSNWVTQPGGSSLLSSYQVETLASKVRTRLNAPIERVVGLDQKAWWPITRQIYADVAMHGKPQRVDTFTGNYGVNRGLSASTLVLASVSAWQAQYGIAIGLLILSLVYAYRAYRFGVHYARELFVQFLILDGAPPSNAA